MRILVYSETFLPQMGGLEHNTFTLCTALQSLGYCPILITNTADSKSENYPFEVYRDKRKWFLLRSIRNSDMVIVNGGLSLKTVIFAFLMRKKYVLIYQMATLYHRESKNILHSVERLIRFFFVTKAAVNVGVTAFATHQLAKEVHTAIATLYNPVSENFSSLISAATTLKKELYKRFDVLYAGRIIDGKGIFLLAEVIHIVSRKNELIWAIAGEGPDLEKLKLVCMQKNIQAVFLGRMNEIDLLNVYYQSKVIVVPSTTHTEGSPLVIAECITAGTPVLVSDQPSMIEIAGDAGYSFRSGDIQDLTEKIKYVLFNEKVLRGLNQACSVEAHKFSYNNYLSSLQFILNTSLNQDA